MKPLHERKMRVIADLCGEGRVLDVGCSARPNPFLKDAVGLDIVSPDAVPPNYRRIILCNLNTETMPVPDASFEAVAAGDLIEHLENPSHFLREANRALVPGGRLIICTPQANDWWVTLHNWFFRRVIGDPDPGEHLQNWTILDMSRLLKKNGFAVQRVEGLYFQTPFLPLRLRVCRFPALAWQVIYVATKVGAPDRSVMVMRSGKREGIGPKERTSGARYVSKDYVIRGSLIDLSDAEKAWSAIDKRVRTSVRKGERMSVRMRPFDGSDEERTALAAFTPNDDDIPAVFEPRHHAFVAVAEETGERLGWILLAGVGRKLFMLCHASTPEGKRRQTPNLLLWHAIRAWSGGPYRYLDVGASYRPSLQTYFSGFRQLEYLLILRPPDDSSLSVGRNPFTTDAYAIEPGDPGAGRRLLANALGTERMTAFPDESYALRAVFRELADQGRFDGGAALHVVTAFGDGIPDRIARAADGTCAITTDPSDRIGAACFVHEHGFPVPEIERLTMRWKELGIPLIEDATEGWGSDHAGTTGDIRVVSLSRLFPIRFGAVASGIKIPFDRMWRVHGCSDLGKETEAFGFLAAHWRAIGDIRSARVRVWRRYAANLQSVSDPAVECVEGVMPYAYPAAVSSDAEAERIAAWLRRFRIDADVWRGHAAVLLPCHQAMSDRHTDAVSGAFLAMFREECGLPRG